MNGGVRRAGQPYRRSGHAWSGERSRGRAPRCRCGWPVWGAHRLCAGHDTTGRRNRPSRVRPRRATGRRDNVPVTMADDDPGRRAGSHGGASLAPPPVLPPHQRRIGWRTQPARPIRPDRDRPGGRPAACYASSTPPTSISAPAMTTSATRLQRSVNDSSPPSSRPSTWPSPRRPTSCSSPATCSTAMSSRAARWSVWRPNSSAWARPRSGRSSSRAPTTATSARPSTGPTTSRPWPAARPTTIS